MNILQNWFDIPATKITPLSSGLINTTYKIVLENEQKFILQKVNTQIFKQPEKIASNVENIAKHLKSKHYTKEILEFIPTKAGHFFVETPENTPPSVYRLTPYFEQTQTFLQVENIDLAEKAATAFGEYALYLSDFPIEKIETILPNFHNLDFRIAQFRSVLLKENIDEIRLKNSENLLKISEHYINEFSVSLDLPLRICHNDTKISNILFRNNTPLSIIDLDTLQAGHLCADFGDMMRTYTPNFDENEKDTAKIEMRMPYFEAIAKGFVRTLTPILTKEEKETLVFGGKMLIFEQALRFLTDYLDNDTYYKTDYPEHNLVRAKNQLALLKSIDNQQIAMEKFVQNL